MIGAGVTGLAVGMASDARVYERAAGPGGICRATYRRPGDPTAHAHPPPEDDAYRFEVPVMSASTSARSTSSASSAAAIDGKARISAVRASCRTPSVFSEA